MGVLASAWIKKETLQELVKKAEKGIAVTISISDKPNDYGQNVTMFESQTKEQREAKEKRNYVANGGVFWTDGNVNVAPKDDVKAEPKVDSKTDYLGEFTP